LRIPGPARLVGLVGIAALLAACGGGAAPTAPASSGSQPAGSAAPAAAAPAAPAASAPLTKVRLRLDWVASGYQAPWVVALQKGYYRDAGLDVDIQEGKGSSTGTQTAANGSDTFAAVDSGTAAVLISKGAPAKVLAVFIQQTPMGFEYMPPFKLTDPHQLLGKTLVTSSGSASQQILPAVLGKYGLKINQMKIVFVEPAAYATTLKEHPDYVILGWLTDDLQSIQKLNPDVAWSSYTDFGVNTLNIGLVAGLDEVNNHPDVVRKFLAASIKGWQDAVADPQAAAQALVKQFPNADAQMMLEELNQSLKMLHTKNTEGKPLGWMAQEDWQQTIDLLHQYGGLETVKPLDAYYTNDFLPQS